MGFFRNTCRFFQANYGTRFLSVLFSSSISTVFLFFFLSSALNIHQITPPLFLNSMEIQERRRWNFQSENHQKWPICAQIALTRAEAKGVRVASLLPSLERERSLSNLSLQRCYNFLSSYCRVVHFCKETSCAVKRALAA